MTRDIIKFIVEAARRYRVPLCLHYYPSVYQGGRYNIYSVTIQGKYLLNFTDKNFYDIPKSERMKHFLPLIKVGLTHNMGENSLKDSVVIPRRMGTTLVKRGIAVA